MSIFGNEKFICGVRFKHNKIIYGQDFNRYVGVPADVDFDVHSFMDDKIVLTGYGYGVLNSGDEAYGNGQIFLSLKEYQGALSGGVAKKIKKVEGEFVGNMPGVIKQCPKCGAPLK